MTDRHLYFVCEIPDAYSLPLRVRRFDVKESIFQPHEGEVHIETTELVDVADLLGKAITLRVQTTPDDERCFHGIVLGADIDAPIGGWAAYRVVIRFGPRLSLLRLGRNSRIFVDETIPDKDNTIVNIVKEVLDEGGIPEDDCQWEETGSYEARDQVTQYDESDFDFISRLLHEEGIGYTVHHDLDRCLLRFFDDDTAFEPIDGVQTLKASTTSMTDTDIILGLREHHRGASDRVTVRDYDFTRPEVDLSKPWPEDGDGELEVYTHGVGYQDEAIGEKRAQQLYERLRLRIRTFSGKSDSPYLSPGRTFEVVDHPRADNNGELYVLNVSHRGRAEDTAGEEGMFTCDFEALPKDTPYRPPVAPPKPRVGGVQIAFVTGPSGSEIHCDANGAVNVHFPWDRDGPTDDTSSTELRVAQLPLSGSMLIPRVGFEVVVGYERGNLDIPYVQQQLYHAENPLPYALPDENVKSSFQTTTTGGGGAGNEFRFGDSAGAEEIFVNAAKDMTVSVENDQTNNVTVDQAVTVGSNNALSVGTHFTETVGGNRTTDVGAGQKREVGKESAESVKGNDSLSVGGMRKCMVGGDLQLNTTGTFDRTVGALTTVIGINGIGRTIKGNNSHTVGAAWIELAAKSRMVSAMNYIETVGALKMIKAKTIAISCGAGHALQTVSYDSKCDGARTDTAKTIMIAAGGGFNVKAKAITLTAESKLTFKAGGCSIELTPTSVTIKASKLDVRGCKAINQALHKAG